MQMRGKKALIEPNMIDSSIKINYSADVEGFKPMTFHSLTIQHASCIICVA